MQNVLDAHNIAGDRTQTHEHYLKGSLYCGCGARMTINNPRNGHGETYPYFICLGRHANTTDCQRQAVVVSTVEHLADRPAPTRRTRHHDTGGGRETTHA